MEFSKFLVKVQPKIICVPDILAEIKSEVRLVCSGILRSPAPDILSCSSFQLVTLHSDRVIRLWNIDDGRCVLSSTEDQIHSKVVGMTVLNDYPGYIAVVGNEADIYIVNVFTMTVENHLCLDFQGFHSITNKGAIIEILDSKGCIFQLADANFALNQMKAVSQNSWNQKDMLKFLKEIDRDKSLNFKFQMYSAVKDQINEKSLRRIQGVQDFLTVHKSQDGYIHVYQDMIQIIYRGKKQVLLEYTVNQHLLQAFFYRDLLVTINKQSQLDIFKINNLLKDHNPTEEQLEVQRVKLVSPFMTLDLLNSKINDYAGLVKKNNWNELTSDFKSQAEEVRSTLQKLKIDHFIFVPSLVYIYTFVDGILLTWPLRHLLEQNNNQSLISMCVTQVKPFKPHGNTGPISYNNILMGKCYKPSMFNFFYLNEKVSTCLTFETWYFFGTTEGRVFQIPMFQDQEGKTQPLQLIANHSSAVTLLYVANNHVISCSNSLFACSKIELCDILPQLPFIERRRIDSIIQQRTTSRRRSIACLPQSDQYFQYVVRKPIFVRDVFEPSQIISVKALDTARPAQYFCVIGKLELTLISWDMRQTTKICQLSAEVVHVLHEQVSDSLLLIQQNLCFTTYNLKSKQHSRRLRTPQDLSTILQVPNFVDQVIAKNRNYFLATSRNDFDITSIENYQKNFNKNQTTTAHGLHQTLDYLMMCQQMPLLYSPQSIQNQGYSVQTCHLLQQKKAILQFKSNNDLEAQNIIIKTILENFGDEDRRYQAASTKHKGITNQKAIICGQQQSVLILNLQEMKNTLTQQMHIQKAQEQNNAFQMQKAGQQLSPPPQQIERFKETWPARIISFVHPFNLSDDLDISFEKYFEIHMPFLNFKIGLQGAKTSMSFVITEEDLNFNREKDNLAKIISLLRISQHERKHKLAYSLERMNQLDANLFLQRFSTSEYWKVSSYLSTIIPVVVFSGLASLVTFDDEEVQYLMQEWLFQFQHIQMGVDFEKNRYSPLDSPKQISIAVLSKLLLVQDIDISYSVKDLILKPLICGVAQQVSKGLIQGYQTVFSQIQDWQMLIIDTYEDMLQEQPKSQVSGQKNSQKYSQQENPLLRYQSMNQSFIETQQSSQNNSNSSEQINHHHVLDFFGELEIAGLISISYFAYLTTSCTFDQVRGMKIGQRALDRSGKLVVVLMKEVVAQFTGNDDSLHLATMLLWPLQFSFKISLDIYRNSSLMEDVVRLLLSIFSNYKTSVEKQFKDITAENFHLMRPLNPESFLKFQANEKLLKIGSMYPDQFLDIIKIQACSLANGPNHQRNVLVTLRFFIKAYSHLISAHLIKIVQILLKCIDPTDQTLRKNSHKQISEILCQLVNMFPMVQFHSQTQRLAVGTLEGPIGLYDVRTSAKIDIFEGHTGQISCLNFDSKGKWLASYSATDLTIKLWKVSDSSFFSQLMGGNSKVANQIKLQSISQPPQVANQNQRNQTDANSQLLIRSMDSQSVRSEQSNNQQNQDPRLNKCKLTFVGDDQRIVELVREDGSKEMHKLVK